MKKGIHPDNYRHVVFLDAAAEFKFLSKSTIKSTETIEWEDGNTYPLVRLDVSSASHPFYTGKQMFVDTAGRVERFQRKFAWKKDSGTEKLSAAEEAREKARETVQSQEDTQRKERAARKKANEERRRRILEEKKKKAAMEAAAKEMAEAEAAAAAAANPSPAPADPAADAGSPPAPKEG